MFDRIRENLTVRSAALLLSIDNGLDRILMWWLLVAGLASTARIVLTPHPLPVSAVSTLTSYMLLVVAPFASTLLALRWFADGHRQAQPVFRLAQVCRWRAVDRGEAERHPLYGTSGIMVSLLVGMMLNV